MLVAVRFHNEFLTARLLGTVLSTLCTHTNRTGSPFTDGTLEVRRGRSNRPPSCRWQVRSRGSHPDSWAPEFTLLTTVLIGAHGAVGSARDGGGPHGFSDGRPCSALRPGLGRRGDERARALGSETAGCTHVCGRWCRLGPPSRAREHRELKPEPRAGVRLRGSREAASRTWRLACPGGKARIRV